MKLILPITGKVNKNINITLSLWPLTKSTAVTGPYSDQIKPSLKDNQHLKKKGLILFLQMYSLILFGVNKLRLMSYQWREEYPSMWTDAVTVTMIAGRPRWMNGKQNKQMDDRRSQQKQKERTMDNWLMEGWSWTEMNGY